MMFETIFSIFFVAYTPENTINLQQKQIMVFLKFNFAIGNNVHSEKHLKLLTSIGFGSKKIHFAIKNTISAVKIETLQQYTN